MARQVCLRLQADANTALNERFLFDDALVFHCHEAHPFAARPRLNWNDLQGTDLVMVRGFTATRLPIEHQLLKHGGRAASACAV
jgi:DNA-binding transcriptional LysR family regulator